MREFYVNMFESTKGALTGQTVADRNLAKSVVTEFEARDTSGLECLICLMIKLALNFSATDLSRFLTY